MAYRVPFRARVKKAVTKALRKLRILRPTERRADMEANPSLVMDVGPMNIEGLGYEMAKEFADDLKELIERQLFAWVPLSSGYARYKRRMGLDPRILIATGRYVNSIEPQPDGKGGWVIGVPDEPLSPGSRYTLKDLARWLEFGTQHMPARPHWRPAMNIWRTKIYQVKRRVRHDLVQQMKKAGYK
jgi:hypothetical protein